MSGASPRSIVTETGTLVGTGLEGLIELSQVSYDIALQPVSSRPSTICSRSFAGCRSSLGGRRLSRSRSPSRSESVTALRIAFLVWCSDSGASRSRAGSSIMAIIVWTSCWAKTPKECTTIGFNVRNCPSDWITADFLLSSAPASSARFPLLTARSAHTSRRRSDLAGSALRCSPSGSSRRRRE